MRLGRIYEEGSCAADVKVCASEQTPVDYSERF